MATFKFGRYIDIHWNGYDIQGPADTVFSIPDQLYEEFDADIAPVEPTLQWIDTNEFQSLSNSVSAATLSATTPITIASTSTGRIISFSSGTALNGYLLSADGAGGAIWNPASTSGLTSVVGVSPISSSVSGGVVSVSLAANYQTAGTYVTGVVGTSPVSASGTTAITVSIDQTALSVADASTAATLRTYVKNSSGSTITKGQVVYITGADGTNALIGLASNTSDAASSKTLGIAANTMTNNAFGYVIENGQLSNIDTSAATAGSAVWLGSTPGSYQFTVPAEPNHAVYLGVVTKANVSTGEILVKVQNGYELNELHDVFTTGVSSSLPLVYNATSDGWIAQELSSVGIADNAIVTTKILDGAVTSAKIANNAVVGSKIIDGAVTSAKIAAGAINSTHIGANAVVAGDIAANAVTSGNIASGSVDTSKISSGSATNGTILTANGSGAASFLPAPISGATLSVWSNSFTVVNGSVQTTKLNNNANTAASFSSIAVDDANNHLYQISSNTVIRKIDLSNNSVLATLTLTLTNSRLVDIAFGSGKLCVVSSPTTALGGHEYRIINASAMTVQNTGNILSASDYNYSGQWASVTYESSLDKFTIHSSGITASTGVPGTSPMFRGLFRIIDPSTYSTRVHRATSNSSQGPGVPNVVASNLAGSGCSHPVWIASASRFASGCNGGRIDFFSDSGASSAFLTATGAATNGPSRFINDIKLSPSTAYPGLYFTMSSTVGYSYENGLGHVLLSAISAAYNSTVTTLYSYNADIIAPGTNKSGSIQDMNVALKNDRIILTLAGKIADMTYYNPSANSGAVSLGVSVATTTSRLSNPAANATAGAGAGCGTAHQIGYNSASNQLYVVSSQYDTTGSGSLHAIRAIVSSYSTYVSINSHTSDFILGTYDYSLTGTYANAAAIDSLTKSTMSTSGNNSIFIVTAGTSESTRYIGDLSGSNAVILNKYWSIKQ